MRWAATLWMRIKMLTDRKRAGERLQDELQFHLEEEIGENMARGMSVEEARFAALRAFGNPVLLREQARAIWSWNWMEQLFRDVRLSVRTLGRSRGFAVIAI